jgi:hypothetical protein
LRAESLRTALVSGPLGFKHDALQFFEYREVLVGVVNFSIALALAYQKSDFFQPFELALDIAGILAYQLS